MFMQTIGRSGETLSPKGFMRLPWIAAELGIVASGAQAVTGTELQQMNRADIQRALRATSVFARVAPEHKLRIVRALKANGEIAAMTGDGVNDAPALKAVILA